LPRSGLKPLFPPEMNGVMPLADAARRICSLVAASGLPLWPHVCGASPQLNEVDVSPTDDEPHRIYAGRRKLVNCAAYAPPKVKVGDWMLRYGDDVVAA